MIAQLDEILGERLRADAPLAWVTAGTDWRQQTIAAFYSSQADFRVALTSVLRDLALAIGPAFKLTTSQIDALSDVHFTVEELIAKIATIWLHEEPDTRDHRGAAPTSVGEGHKFAMVKVFYATDREPMEAERFAQEGFSANRSHDSELTFGYCNVSVPAIHTLGMLESPSWFRLEFKPDPRKHIVLYEVITSTEAAFFDQLARSVASSPSRDAFVFIHGYNVSFPDAARRTGQIAFDLNFTGAPILYSWPSNGHLLDYFKDEANVIWTVPHLERFLALLVERSGAERVHLIAHSMGNRAVCDTLERLATITQEEARRRFHHLVLTAPDIDAGTFKELAERIQMTSETVTLYASSTDKAIRLSSQIHGNPRAGTPVLIVPGVETVDASDVDTDFLGHSFFSSARSVLSDIYGLLRHDQRAADRFGVKKLQRSGETYYVIQR